MTPRKKFLTAIGLLWGIPLIGILGAGAWITSAGVISINVKGRGPGGDRVHVRVPAAMVDMLLHCVPDDLCMEASEEVARWGPMVKAACGELSRCADGVFVEVEGDDEMVLIAKRGGAIVIDVETVQESVHVRLPLATVRNVVSKIERIRGTTGRMKESHRFKAGPDTGI